MNAEPFLYPLYLYLMRDDLFNSVLAKDEVLNSLQELSLYAFVVIFEPWIVKTIGRKYEIIIFIILVNYMLLIFLPGEVYIVTSETYDHQEDAGRVFKIVDPTASNGTGTHQV